MGKANNARNALTENISKGYFMIIKWQELYGTSRMDDMRDMIAPIHRLINKLEDAKTAQTSKPMLEVDHYLITEINKAQAHWRRILEMVTHQRGEDD